MTTPLERLAAGYYNSLPKSVDNPGGLAHNGHVVNFPAAAKDIGEGGQTIIADTAAQRAAIEADNDATTLAVAALKDAAQTARDDAQAARATAITKATEATDARDLAVRRTASDVPDRFDIAGAWFTGSATGDPAAVNSPAGANVVAVAGFGYAFHSAGAASVFSKGAQLTVTDAVYEITADIEQVSIGGGETPAARIRVQGLNSAYASTGAQVTGPLTVTPVGVTTITRRVAGSAIENGTIWPQVGTAMWLRVGVDINRKSDDSAAAAGSVARVRRVTIRDVTSVYKAEVQAAAAALSAASITPGVAPFNIVQLDGSSRLPAVDGSLLTNVDRINRRQVSAGTTLVATDRGGMVEVTANTLTIAITAAATLGDGWFCYTCNSGVGDVTIDPNAAELIDGVATRLSYPNEMLMLGCNGVGFWTRVIRPFVLTTTTTRAFLKQPGYRNFGGTVTSGGASGQKTGSATLSLGGAGGASIPFSLPAALFAASETLTVGSGGAAVTTTGQNIGNDSSVGALLVVEGGQLGKGGGLKGITEQAIYGGLNPAGSSNSTFTLFGGDAPRNDNFPGTSQRAQRGAPAGGAISSGGSALAPNTNGTGKTGGVAAVAASGLAGTGAGAGGGATQTGPQSGPGNAGEIVIWGEI